MKRFINFLNTYTKDIVEIKEGETINWNLLIDGSLVAEAGFSSDIEENTAQLYVRDLSGDEPVNVLWAEYDSVNLNAEYRDEKASIKVVAEEFAQQIRQMERLVN